VLYKKSKKLNLHNPNKDGGFYLVEISTNQDNYLFIAAFDMNSPESLLIELNA